jgi:hypothetical protein
MLFDVSRMSEELHFYELPWLERGVFEWISWLHGSFLRVLLYVFFGEKVKTYVMAPISYLNNY